MDEPKQEYHFELAVNQRDAHFPWPVICVKTTCACLNSFRGGLLWLKDKLQAYRTWSLCTHCQPRHWRLCMAHTKFCAECAVNRIVGGTE